MLWQKKKPVAMPTVVVTRENVILVAVPHTCLPHRLVFRNPLCTQWVCLVKFRQTNKFRSSFLPLPPSRYSPFLSLCTGNSRICLPDHFHDRDIYEDYCLRPGHAPKLLRQEWLEHAGLCHRHSWVSSDGIICTCKHVQKGRNTHNRTHTDTQMYMHCKSILNRIVWITSIILIMSS